MLISMDAKEWLAWVEELHQLRKENKILKEKADGLYLLMCDNPKERKLADRLIEHIEGKHNAQFTRTIK